MMKTIIIGIVVTVVGLFMLSAVHKVGGGNISSSNGDKTTLVEDANNVKVTISGEINHPGEYSILSSLTLGDLITMAGGVTTNAVETAYNASLIISTRTAFYIAPISTGSGLCVDTTLRKVNINTASESELLEVGFNSTQAPNVIDYRLANGDYQAIEDVMKVKGVGQATFEKVKNKISIA